MKYIAVLQKYLFILMAVTLPMYTIVNNIALGGFVLLSILRGDFKNNIKNIKLDWKKGIPVFLFFVLAFFGAFVVNPDEPFKHIERYWSFLLIPLVAIGINDFFGIYSKLFFNSLAVGCIFTLLICYSNVFFEIITRSEPWSYFLRWRHLSHQFTEIADTHPAYLGVFIITSIIFILFYSNWKNKFKVFTIILFTLGMMQLSSRLAIFIFVIVLASSLLYLYGKRIIIPIIFVILSITFIASFGSQYLKSRLSVDLIYSDIRFERLKASYEVFKLNPILGVGFSQIKTKRELKYKEYGYEVAAKENYNAHNQLFEYLGINGLLGGIVFLGVFCFLIIHSFMLKEYMFFILFTVFFIANITESMMVRIKGIEYFCWITMLFLLKKTKE